MKQRIQNPEFCEPSTGSAGNWTWVFSKRSKKSKLLFYLSNFRFQHQPFLILYTIIIHEEASLWSKDNFQESFPLPDWTWELSSDHQSCL